MELGKFYIHCRDLTFECSGPVSLPSVRELQREREKEREKEQKEREKAAQANRQIKYRTCYRNTVWDVMRGRGWKESDR